MRKVFVKTSNVTRFWAGATSVQEQTAAPEARLVLATGEAGFGKSKTATHWAVQQDAVLVRVGAAITPHWMLSLLAKELGIEPERSCERLFGRIADRLEKEPRAIVLDEMENALRDIRCVDIVRDLTDTLDLTMVLVGRANVRGRLERHRQIWSRVSAVVEFEPTGRDDVRLLCDELCEVPVDDAVVDLITAEAGGLVREVVKAIENVERLGKRHGGKKVTVDQVSSSPLTRQYHGRRARPSLKAVS